MLRPNKAVLSQSQIGVQAAENWAPVERTPPVFLNERFHTSDEGALKVPYDFIGSF